jgi:hypothetical protein
MNLRALLLAASSQFELLCQKATLFSLSHSLFLFFVSIVLSFFFRFFDIKLSYIIQFLVGALFFSRLNAKQSSIFILSREQTNSPSINLINI